MKNAFFSIAFILILTNCFAQEKTSNKKFENITLLNKIEFYNAKFDQPKFGCAFLLKFGADTFAITAKHLLKFIKTEEMKSVSFENSIKSWSLFSLSQPSNKVICDRLLNENKSELLADKITYENDWLVFSIKQNATKVKVSALRTTPLIPNEKIYVIGWTRTMEEGIQRVYEFKYHKTIGNRILLEDVIVPEKLGGLSGAPVVDENGLVVGIVSGATVDPEDGKRYFSPCAITQLAHFIQEIKK